MPSRATTGRRTDRHRQPTRVPGGPKAAQASSESTSIPHSSRLQEALWLFVVVATPLVMNPWGIQVFDLPKIALLRLTITAMAVLWLWRRCSSIAPIFSLKWPLPWLDPRFWAAALGIIWTAASLTAVDTGLALLGSYNHQEGLYTSLAYLLLFGLVATELRHEAQAKRLFLGVACSSLVVVAYGLLQWRGLDPALWQVEDESHVLSSVGRSNFVGSYLAMAMPLTAAALVFCRELWLRAVLAVGLLGSLALLGLTESRSAWLGLTIALLVILGWGAAGRIGWRRLAYSAALTAVALLVVAAAFWSILMARGQTQPNQAVPLPELSGSPRARLLIWEASLELVGQRPVLGFGPEGFALAFHRVFPPQLVWHQGRVITDRAHNVLLQTAVTTGLLGLVVYIAFAGLLLVRLGRGLSQSTGNRRAAGAAILAAVVAHLVDLLFSFEVASTAAVFWVVAGAGVGLSRLEREERTSKGRDAPRPDEYLLRGRRLVAGALAGAALVAAVMLNLLPVAADTYAGLALRDDLHSATRLAYAGRAVSLWPLEPGHWIELGLLYFQAAQGEADPRPTLEQAERKLEVAVAKRSLDPLAWSALGEVRTYRAIRLRDENVFRAAEMAYERALDLAPNMATLYVAYGTLELSGGRLERAIEILERATRLDTTDAQAWRYLSQAYRAAGRDGDAADALARARRLEQVPQNGSR